jgi:hypothetical protein
MRNSRHPGLDPGSMLSRMLGPLLLSNHGSRREAGMTKVGEVTE